MVIGYWRPARPGLLALSILMALLAALPGQSQAKETLIWLVRDFPPLNIFYGPLRGQGAIDRLIPELIAQMPEYNHQIMHVNRARGTQMLQDPEVFACDPTLLWTEERAKHILFSIPTYATPSNGVTINQKDHALFAPFVSEDGRLDLAQVLNSRKIKIGIVAERSYGPVIDNVLHQYPQDNLVLHYGNAAVGSMLQMERAGRFEAFISYWPEARFHAQQQSVPLNELEFYPVKDVPKYQFAHIGCSNSEQGQRAMDMINREMRVLRSTRLIGFYAQWMAKREEYLQDAKTFFADQ
ncbi:TIGR02285 family protein [Pseudomonas huanghezhanensis]|uniref:TIGR02285 family protein n=1 Tax=Pseudomonas huanghezhanensis TaxID=3002903 RepID=UPI002286209D|nr:TIGR02285 family protein [Pseudomonas sp. BSw22131]